VALTSGYSLAFSVVAGISAAGVVTALVFIKGGSLADVEAEADIEAAEAMA